VKIMKRKETTRERDKEEREERSTAACRLTPEKQAAARDQHANLRCRGKVGTAVREAGRGRESSSMMDENGDEGEGRERGE
jgi:hypothetical protein